jgi:hypothetical protein
MTDQIQNVEIVPAPQTALMQSTSMEATIAAAVEAQSRAVVQARYALALRNPRDMDMVRQRLLKECSRPGFAEVARYSKKQGKKQNDLGKWVDNYVTGPSIRFAEAVLRFYGNVLDEEAVIHDDKDIRVVRVTVTDLEANLTYSADVIITKAVERSSATGREVISARPNSNDKMTYLVKATEDEVFQRQGSLISKALRKAVDRMLPRDIRDECMDRVVAVQAKQDRLDPDAQRKKLFDSFGALGVSPTDIKDYLGHEVGLEDLSTLRGIYQSLKQGDAKWSTLMAEKRADESEQAPTGDLAEKLAQKEAKAADGKAARTKTEAKPSGTHQANEPTPDALLHFEAALAEAETTAQVEALARRIMNEVPRDAPGRSNLDRLFIMASERTRGHS